MAKLLKVDGIKVIETTMLTNDEQVYFLSLCKRVREHQKKSEDVYTYTIHITNVNKGHNFSIKKMYALAYSLEKKGFVKINSKKCMGLDTKGIEYIQYLRNNLKNNK